MEQLSIDFTKPLIHRENNSESQNVFDRNIEHFSKQCRIVYSALNRGERLTTASALIDYGVGDLRRRIKDLKDNYGITNIREKMLDGRFKEWYMEK